ncbi:MAG: efflux transporter outer membrane subunit [Betaproteobacteria bacterium]|nr:efflux transporter outer membrane subunit [Betaproteobacteria bacterium]
MNVAKIFGAHALILFLLAGCAGAPSYERPAVDLPSGWRGAPAQGVTATGERWWTIFSDASLERLIEQALFHNQDLALAAARVDEARALLRATDSARMPSVDADFQGDRLRLSERTSTPLPPGAPLASTNYRGQLNVAYEVDLWGRLSSATRAARAELLASEAARETVRIALVAEVVRGYFALLALDAQVASTNRALRLRTDSLALQKVRAKAGLVNDLNLRQLEAEIAAAQAQLPALQTSRTAQELALAVLAGRSPLAIVEGELARGPEEGEPLPPVIPEGLPSDLLLRRPDIAEAEQRLIGANARIAEARAALFPRIALTGFLGSESAALGDLFSGPATIWSLAFAVAQPIFQGGRLTAEIEAVKARERQALAQYQKTLQAAFSEVRQALSAQARAREAFEAENARMTALAEALRLARVRYENGLLSQLEVIDSERNLLQAQLNRSDALRAQRAAAADIVKALGGGWSGLGAAPFAQGPSAKQQ